MTNKGGGRDACETAELIKYAGTKREHRVPLIMPVAPWCKVHDEPRPMCELRKKVRALEAELADAKAEQIQVFGSPTKERKALLARAERAEARVKELEAAMPLAVEIVSIVKAHIKKARERDE